MPLLLLITVKIISHQQKKSDNDQCGQIVMGKKKHKKHAYRNPESNKADHFFHSAALFHIHLSLLYAEISYFFLIPLNRSVIFFLRKSHIYSLFIIDHLFLRCSKFIYNIRDHIQNLCHGILILDIDKLGTAILNHKNCTR